MAETNFPQQVPLPPTVEELIDRICRDQNQPPLRDETRSVLAELNEEAALHLLRFIAGREIRSTFDGFVWCLVRRYTNSCSTNGSPTKCLPLSPYSPSRQQQQRSSAITPTRLMMNSPVGKVLQSHISIQGEESCLKLEREKKDGFSPQLEALGELDFKKAFLILSYLGSKSLEEVLTAVNIRELKDLPMDSFEKAVWSKRGNINEEDRIQYVDWNAANSIKYHCHVYTDGSHRFKGPYITYTKNFLQKSIGDDNILTVKFAEEAMHERNNTGKTCDYFATYKNLVREGILVGLRRYRFFVFKDGGKEERKKDPTTSPVKCYFVRMESNASIDLQDYIFQGKTVREARSLFMNVDSVKILSKYMARFSLILSNTISLDEDLKSVIIETISDIGCKDDLGNDVLDQDGKSCIHTDGTGFISGDLASRCPMGIFKGKCSDENVRVSENLRARSCKPKIKRRKISEMMISGCHNADPPLLIQCRLFNNGMAVKGTLLVNKKLCPRTIIVRPSMIKVEEDLSTSNFSKRNSLEIVTTSNRPKKTFLSKNLIALLTHGGVPREFFLNLLCTALEESKAVSSNKRAALRVAISSEMDDLCAARLILSGIPLEESYLRHRLSILIREEKKNLRVGKLPLPESYYLMGTTDPTGQLERDEVCIILENGQISGDVLVYRNPGLHFGDIHILKATYVKALEDFVGNSKYGIFFPCKGSRSLADEMAGGDYDGDMFFVSRNPQLLETFKQSEPGLPALSSTSGVPNKIPSNLSDVELEDNLFEMFLSARFSPSYTVGMAADSWLAMMDRFLTLGDDHIAEKDAILKNINQLIDIYYVALDAPKHSGRKIELPDYLKAEVYPHYMEKKEEISYKSTSILGVIYDTVKSFEENNVAVQEIQKLSCFAEREARESSKTKWGELYRKYLMEMKDALYLNKESKTVAADKVIEKYKQILYDAPNYEDSKRRAEDLFDEALAIYHLCYDKAILQNKVERCGFVWKVAGEALCRFYMVINKHQPITCSSSTLLEILF